MEPSATFYQRTLLEHYQKRLNANRRYSKRAYARDLRINCGALCQIMSGKRIPSLKSSERLMNGLKLSVSEREDFLESLSQAQRTRGLVKTPSFYREVCGKHRRTTLSGTTIEALSEWYHYAILELTFLRDFEPVISWIARRLGLDIATTQHAVDQLFQAGLLVEDRNRWKKSTERLIRPKKLPSSTAIHRLRASFLERLTLDHDDLARGLAVNTCATVSIDPRKIPIAKKMISDFAVLLCETLDTDEPTEIYQINLSLDPLSRRNK